MRSAARMGALGVLVSLAMSSWLCIDALELAGARRATVAEVAGR